MKNIPSNEVMSKAILESYDEIKKVLGADGVLVQIFHCKDLKAFKEIATPIFEKSFIKPNPNAEDKKKAKENAIEHEVRSREKATKNAVWLGKNTSCTSSYEGVHSDKELLLGAINVDSLIISAVSYKPSIAEAMTLLVARKLKLISDSKAHQIAIMSKNFNYLQKFDPIRDKNVILN